MMKLKGLKERIMRKVRMKIGRMLARLARIAAGLCVPAFFLAGCQATPSRVNSMRLEGCTITVNPPAGDGRAAGDVFTQAMAIETGRDELLAPSAPVSASADLGTDLVGGLSRLLPAGGKPKGGAE